MASSSDSSSWYTSTAQSGPLLLMQHSHPTLAFKLFILFPPTLYLLPVHPHHRLMLLAVSLYLLLPLPLPKSLRVLQWNAGGVQTSSTTGSLFCLIPLTLFLSRNLTLIYLPFSGSLDSLLCDPMAPTPDVVFFLLMSQTLAVASSFSSGRDYPSLRFLPPPFLRLTPTLIYVGVNISLNDSSLLSFLNVYAPSICSSSKDSRINFFSPSIIPSYVEAEAVEFSRFRFHRKGTAPSFRFRFHIPGFGNSYSQQQLKGQFWSNLMLFCSK